MKKHRVLNVVRVVFAIGVGVAAVCVNVFGTVVPRRMAWELLLEPQEIDPDRLQYMRGYLPTALEGIFLFNVLAVLTLTFLALLPYLRGKQNVQAENANTKVVEKTVTVL